VANKRVRLINGNGNERRRRGRRWVAKLPPSHKYTEYIKRKLVGKKFRQQIIRQQLTDESFYAGAEKYCSRFFGKIWHSL
jgi:hypothetical protein